MIDGSFKICKNWNSFYKDIENIKSYLIKNAYPLLLIDKVIKFSSNQNRLRDTFDVYYFKLPYIGNLLHHIKNKLSKLCKECYKENFNIELVSRSFKIKNYFSYKDPIPGNLKFFLVQKFSCSICSSSYIGETCRHYKTRIEEHIKKDNKSHILKHLTLQRNMFWLNLTLSFKIIDKTNSKFGLKIKERTTKPFSSHTVTIASVIPLLLFLLCFFLFFLHFLHSLSLTLVVVIFQCLITFAITSSHYSTPSITPFLSIIYFHCSLLS